MAVIRINAQPDDLPVTTYKRAAYEAIRDMIVELEIPPGARLVESDLASRLRVSKTPIREAIALLETDSLVSIAPYRGGSRTDRRPIYAMPAPNRAGPGTSGPIRADVGP